jgi:hypothetical protein
VEKRSLLKLANLDLSGEFVAICSRAVDIPVGKPPVNRLLFPEIPKEVFMAMDGLKKNNSVALKTALLMATFIAAVSIPVKPARAEDESIEVSCFKGNLDEGSFIGNLTVNDPRNAGHDCNLEYYDCKGECVGCLTDSDSKQLCYDDSGTKLTK